MSNTNIFEIERIGAKPRPLEGVDADAIELGDRPPRRAAVYVKIPIVGEPPYRLAKAGEGLVLKHWDGDDAPIYVVLRCKDKYHRYDVHDLVEESTIGVEILARGWLPWGEAGNLGGEPEYLLRVSDPCMFAVRGEYDKVIYYALSNGEWLVESYPERVARMAAEAAEKGEVEWL